jgi:hypothetical protein
VQNRPCKYTFLALLIFLSAACGKKLSPEKTEGRIRYRISYEKAEVGGYSANVLPREMSMEFSGDMVRNTIEGGLGFFSLVHVTDLRFSQHTTWLKFIDKRYIYEGEKREKPCCFGMLDGMVLEYTDSTKEIAGLKCQHAVAIFPGNGIKPFDVWYTDEIKVKNPNNNSPFMEIPGVLLEFNTLMGNANMHMEAIQYEARKIPQKQFQVPKNYRPVTKAEMESILNALMN